MYITVALSPQSYPYKSIEKFPYKLVLHVLLVVLTTIQVCLVVDSDYTEHAREQFRVFKYILLVLFIIFFHILLKDAEEDQSSQKFLTTGDFQVHLQTLIEVIRDILI